MLAWLVHQSMISARIFYSVKEKTTMGGILRHSLLFEWWTNLVCDRSIAFDLGTVGFCFSPFRRKIPFRQIGPAILLLSSASKCNRPRGDVTVMTIYDMCLD